MVVENLESHNGNKVPNQFSIELDGVKLFQSYDSVIVKIAEGIVFLDEKYWDYSNTTNKYRNLFLGEDTATIKKKVKQNIYKLQNLN
jgi:hypothetical protein